MELKYKVIRSKYCNGTDETCTEFDHDNSVYCCDGFNESVRRGAIFYRERSHDFWMYMDTDREYTHIVNFCPFCGDEMDISTSSIINRVQEKVVREITTYKWNDVVQ